MCKFLAVQSKTEGMAASVRVVFEHPLLSACLHVQSIMCHPECNSVVNSAIPNVYGHSIIRAFQ